MPFAAISSGKSFLWSKMQAYLPSSNILPFMLSFDSVSSDVIRSEQTKKLMKEKGVSEDEAFNMSGKNANKVYNQT